MRLRAARAALAAALLAAALAPRARGETVLGVGGLVVEGRVRELEPGALVVETGGGGRAPPVRVALEDLVEIRYGAARTAAEEAEAVSVAPRTILFENGDRVEGDLVRIELDRLLLATPRLGALSVPLPRLRGVLHERQGVPEAVRAAARAAVEGDAAAPEDVLFLASGDRLAGAIGTLAGGRVEMEHLALQKRVVVDLHDVIALRFARVSGPAPETGRGEPGVIARLEMRDGSRLSGPLVGASSEKLRIAWLAGAGERGAPPPLAVPVREIESVSFRGGRLAWLSDLEPGAREETPLLGARFSLARDRTTTGRTLSIAGRSFRRGLATRSRSRYTWALPGAFEAFESYIGIDDEAGASGQGRAVFRVLVDGAEKYDSGPVRGGEEARYVRVALAGAKELTLCVDEGEELDLADLADWAEAHLVRPKTERKEGTE